MAVTFRTYAPWCRPRVLAGACRQNVPSNTSIGDKRSSNMPWRRCWRTPSDACHHRHQSGDARFAQLPLAAHPQITVVDGGAERAPIPCWRHRAAGDAQWVLVHDAARPCLHQDDLAPCWR